MLNHFSANNLVVLSGMYPDVVEKPDRFGRDVAWITAAIIETYAAYCLRSDSYAEQNGLALCGYDKIKFDTLRSICHDGNKRFVWLKEELLAKHGRDYFQPRMSTDELLRLTESMMRKAARVKDHVTYAELFKYCRELRDELG